MAVKILHKFSGMAFADKTVELAPRYGATTYMKYKGEYYAFSNSAL